jgi:steroid 5-alpha reductase family enzyme
MSFGYTLLIGWLGASVMMALLWQVHRSRGGNTGIVDVAWAFGTGALGTWFASVASGYAPRRFIVAAMAAIWAGRLGIHLLHRIRRETEDGRYRALRETWGRNTSRNLFLFFQVQALWAVMFAAPMLAAAGSMRMAFGRLDSLGVLCWLVALAGESAADRQLARFKADPASKGRVCRVGLWKYSRHPNYFFEWIHWWAYVFLAVGSPYWWVTPLGVVVMLVFLTLITGIPATEAQALRSRGAAYRDYQHTTSAFFPWFPGKEGAR